MKKVIISIIVLSFGIIVMEGCKKKEINNQNTNTTTTTTTPTGSTTTVFLSPCTSTLNDNKVTTNLAGASNMSQTTINYTTTAITTSGSQGSVDIVFGDNLKAGEYNLVQDVFPDAGEANISIGVMWCSVCPFLSTSGTLFVSDTLDQYWVEFCDVNHNGKNGISTPASGRIIVDK